MRISNNEFRQKFYSDKETKQELDSDQSNNEFRQNMTNNNYTLLLESYQWSDPNHQMSKNPKDRETSYLIEGQIRKIHDRPWNRNATRSRDLYACRNHRAKNQP